MPRVLGVDLGTRRVGLAVGDTAHPVATPLDTLDAGKPDNPEWPQTLADRLTEVAAAQACELIVVGLPRGMSGRDTAATQSARTVARALTSAGWSVELWDERLSSAEAERMLLEAGTRRRERRASRDRVAATLILQGWLDARGMRGH